MFEFKIFLLLAFIASYLPFSSSLSEESVPVLIWSDQRPPIETPAVPALPVPFPHLQGKYLETFNPKNILLFLQDTLSVEDLSSHENEFKNVKKYMDQGHSLYLPAVEVSDSLPHSFTANGYKVTTLEPGSSVGELVLEKDTQNLVLVKLPPTKTNPSRQKALQKSNEIIQNVLSKVGKVADFTVIYTGAGPSVKLESKMEHRRTSRSLQQLDSQSSNDTNFHYTKCVLLYLRDDIQVQKGNSSFYYLFNNHTSQNRKDCHDTHASILIYYTDVAEKNNVKVEFNFTRNERRWTLDYVKLTEGMKDENVKDIILLPQWPMEHVPLNKSYSCSLRLILESNATDPDATYTMIINGLQVQPFTSGEGQFADAWDCIGFFTIPIWMGLFTSILFALILAVGMFMLSDIKTMDRFDDPKGKHIMVAAAID